MHKEPEGELDLTCYLDHISEIETHESYEKVLVVNRLEENVPNDEVVEDRKRTSNGTSYPVLINLCTFGTEVEMNENVIKVTTVEIVSVDTSPASSVG